MPHGQVLTRAVMRFVEHDKVAGVSSVSIVVPAKDRPPAADGGSGTSFLRKQRSERDYAQGMDLLRNLRGG